jgi:hypothetical protein
MATVWGLVESKAYWSSFFATATASKRRKPLLWVCRHSPAQENLLRDTMRIYDPFIGFAYPEKVATCLGILNTRGYRTDQGMTIELQPLEAIPNPVSLSHLSSIDAIPDRVGGQLGGCGALQLLEASHWDRIKTVIAEMNPLLTSSLATLENWRQRREYLERILEIVARRGCSEEQEQELFAVLRTLIRGEPDPPESFGPLALQTRMRLALRAQLLPAKEWEQLWKTLVDNWYGYVMTLTPQEVNRLTDLNDDIQL